jgi:RNase P protein component
LLREAVRRHWHVLPAGIDVVLHARPRLATAQAREVENEIVRMLPKAARKLR